MEHLAALRRVISRKKIKTIFETAKDMLFRVGIEFETRDSLNLFKQHGARVEGKWVFISSGLLAEALTQMLEYRYMPAGKKRLASYVLPERSDSQKALLQKYLPAQCRY